MYFFHVVYYTNTVNIELMHAVIQNVNTVNTCIKFGQPIVSIFQLYKMVDKMVKAYL